MFRKHPADFALSIHHHTAQRSPHLRLKVIRPRKLTKKLDSRATGS